MPRPGGRALAGAGLKPRLQQHRQKGAGFRPCQDGRCHAMEGGQFCPQPAFSRLGERQLACAAKSGSAAGRVPAISQIPDPPPRSFHSGRRRICSGPILSPARSSPRPSASLMCFVANPNNRIIWAVALEDLAFAGSAFARAVTPTKPIQIVFRFGKSLAVRTLRCTMDSFPPLRRSSVGGRAIDRADGLPGSAPPAFHPARRRRP
jgi:hypothetical protein